MKIYFKQHQGLRRAFYFYPLQLVLMTLKENLPFVFVWLFFFGFITRSLAAKYGVPYLFLYPEYLNHVGIRAYMILGFSCGGFIMAYNISSYIVNSFRFPFLATLDRPFFTYCLNNFPIPLAFIITYCGCSIHFRTYDGSPFSLIALHLLGFLIGLIVFLIITVIYFYFFDKGTFKVFGIAPPKTSKVQFKKEKIKLGYGMEWESASAVSAQHSDRTWYIETYIGGRLKMRLTRGYEHYDNRMLQRIFRRNHQTGTVFEVISILTLLMLGLFRDNPVFMLPAGASVFLLFTIFMMLLSAIHNFFRGWTTTVVILLLVAINVMSLYHWSFFSGRAYGLNYGGKKATYSYAEFAKMDNDTASLRRDEDAMIAIMDKWKRKNSSEEKPPMVFINTSGGGLRSAMWTFFTLQYADSALNGSLFKHAQLITGSSGGMIGAAYFRELYLEQEQNKIKDINSRTYLNNISDDILNPVAFTIATNDLAFRFQKYRDGKYTYTRDRGLAFEHKLDENTDSVLCKTLDDYRNPEENARIPMMIITPTVVNDGRKMLISPLGLAFMTDYSIDSNVTYMPLPQSIEFTKLFAGQDAGNLLFTSALRMNATFPYITPVTALPSRPVVDVMDAGLLDNFGLEETVKFMYSFRKWLQDNTGRIIIIQIRDQYKEPKIVNNAPKDIVQSFTFPINQFYNNLFPVENYKEDRIMEYLSRWYKGKVSIVYFQLNNEGNDDISLSWHLTQREKNRVINSMNQDDNKQSLKELHKLLK